MQVHISTSVCSNMANNTACPRKAARMNLENVKLILDDEDIVGKEVRKSRRDVERFKLIIYYLPLVNILFLFYLTNLCIKTHKRLT